MTLKEEIIIEDKERQVKIIHIIPIMSDEERTKTKKRIGNELHDIILKIYDKLSLDSEK